MSLEDQIGELVELARQEGYQRGVNEGRNGGSARDAAMGRMVADILNVLAAHTSPGYAALIRRQAESMAKLVEPPTAKIRTHTAGELHVEFSQPMNSATLLPAVKVAPASGGPALVIGGSYDEMSMSLVIKPINKFTKGVEYRATIDGGAASAFGVPVGDDVELTFTGR